MATLQTTQFDSATFDAEVYAFDADTQTYINVNTGAQRLKRTQQSQLVRVSE